MKLNFIDNDKIIVKTGLDVLKTTMYTYFRATILILKIKIRLYFE